MIAQRNLKLLLCSMLQSTDYALGGPSLIRWAGKEMTVELRSEGLIVYEDGKSFRRRDVLMQRLCGRGGGTYVN